MRLKLWKTKPILWLRMTDISRSVSRLTSCPSRRYVPPSNVSRRPAMFRKVVFPEPERPMSATNSPDLTSREKSWSACVSTRSVR